MSDQWGQQTRKNFLIGVDHFFECCKNAKTVDTGNSSALRENAAENKSLADSIIIYKLVRKIFTSDEDAALRSSH